MPKLSTVRLYLFMFGLVGMAIIVSLVFRKPYTFNGALIEPANQAPDFALTKSDGSVFRLSEQRGKVVLLFFGYTSCPDVCPVTLANFRRVHSRLMERAMNVKFVMITADPERDTPDKVATYAAQFNPDFIGLSGSRTELETIWAAYGVFVEKDDTGSAAGYLVNHTARIYVIDRQGNLRLTFPYGLDAESMELDIIQLLNQE